MERRAGEERGSNTSLGFGIIIVVEGGENWMGQEQEAERLEIKWENGVGIQNL